MIVKTVCPPNCPRRCAGCGATCQKFLDNFEEKKRRYAAENETSRINEVRYYGVDATYRKKGEKRKQI